jgi:hypothetical protein
MAQVTQVKALEPYRIWLKFSDGIEGIIDISDIIGKGVFKTIEDPGEFAKVGIDPLTHTVAWPGGIDLCPDSLYKDVKAQTKAA